MATDDLHDLATRYLTAQATIRQCQEQHQCALDAAAAIAMRLREHLPGKQSFLVLQQSNHILEIRDNGIEVHEALIVDVPAAPAVPIPPSTVSHDSLAPLLQEFVRRAGGKQARELLVEHGQAMRLSEVPADKLPALHAALVKAIGMEA